jgi:hypothetical protein
MTCCAQEAPEPGSAQKSGYLPPANSSSADPHTVKTGTDTTTYADPIDEQRRYPPALGISPSISL